MTPPLFEYLSLPLVNPHLGFSFSATALPPPVQRDSSGSIGSRAVQREAALLGDTASCRTTYLGSLSTLTGHATAHLLPQ